MGFLMPASSMFQPCGRDRPNCRDIYTSLDSANNGRTFFLLIGSNPHARCKWHLDSGALLEYALLVIPGPEFVDHRSLTTMLRSNERCRRTNGERPSPTFYASDGRAYLLVRWDCRPACDVERQGCAVKRSPNWPILAPPGTFGWSKDVMCIPRHKSWKAWRRRSG